MAKRTESLVDLPAELLRLELTQLDLMADLDPGWLDEWEPEVPDTTSTSSLEPLA